VDASVIHAVRSDTRYAAPTGPVGTREGLWTYAAHLRWADPAVAPGLWLEGELAHQRHSDFDMSAWAGYGTVGYLARDLPWTPSLSYRFSGFSGDDPETGTYERFDALYNGGLGEWLQGISISKLVRPENRLTHRLRLNVAPDPRLNLTLDWFLHRADQLNNIGANPAIAQLSSRDLGQELQLAGRWAISDRLYFLGIAGAAFPGRRHQGRRRRRRRAVDDAAGPAVLELLKGDRDDHRDPRVDRASRPRQGGRHERRVNAVINGAIQFFLLRGHGPIALSVDAISTDEHTVLGGAVMLAVSLAMILTAVTHLTLKGPKRPFFPDILWLTIKHGFFAFGVLVEAPCSGSGRPERWWSRFPSRCWCSA
jgi:hypothetical protein